MKNSFNYPVSRKTQFFLSLPELKGDINKIFDFVAEEDTRTISQVFNQGVDINFDVDAPNKLNMFNWSITAHRVCNPYFLELMFIHKRQDIKEDGQKVFNASCHYGDTRHIDIFMKRYETYQWDLFEGMKHAIKSDNLANFYYLKLYTSLKQEQKLELFEKATSSYVTAPRIISYIHSNWNIPITKEKLLEVIETHFCSTLSLITKLYLIDGGKPFLITNESIQKVLERTSDRLQNLEILQLVGFELETSLEEISKKDLPRPGCTMYYTRNNLNNLNNLIDEV
jgi:hypothetical protein